MGYCNICGGTSYFGICENCDKEAGITELALAQYIIKQEADRLSPENEQYIEGLKAAVEIIQERIDYLEE